MTTPKLPSAEERAKHLVSLYERQVFSMRVPEAMRAHLTDEFNAHARAVLEAAAKVAECGDEPEDIAAEIRALKTDS